jgi:hypothetical protein
MSSTPAALNLFLLPSLAHHPNLLLSPAPWCALNSFVSLTLNSLRHTSSNGKGWSKSSRRWKPHFLVWIRVEWTSMAYIKPVQNKGS